MNKIILSAKQAFSNRIIHYIFSRYFTYLIQFVNSLLIAVYLGPFYLGVWGFLTLVIQYFGHINFGISHALNALISIKKENEEDMYVLFNTSFSMVGIVSFLAILFFIINYAFNLNIGKQYEFNSYAIVVCLIAVINYFNSIFSNLFRVHNRLFEIAFSQSVFPLLMCFCICMAKGELLVKYLLGANLLAFLISLLLFVRNCPVKIKLMMPKGAVCEITRRGMYLFLYNTSFYLIVISTRSIVSANFSVEEFGYFTFSFTLANIVLLLFDSFSFLIFPKTLNRLAIAENTDALKLIERLRNDYVTSTHAVVHLVILLFPIFLYHFPGYQNANSSFKLIALSLVLYTNCFGYSSLLIAKSKEKLLGLLALVALLINIGIAITLIKFVHVNFETVILSTAIAYLIYLFLITYYGRRVLEADVSLSKLVISAFPLNIMLPYLVSIILVCIDFPDILYILPVVLFIVLNWRKLKFIFNMVVNISRTPEILNI